MFDFKKYPIFDYFYFFIFQIRLNQTERAETLRQQILADPALMRQLTQSNPELAEAAKANSANFVQLLTEMERQRREAEAKRQRELDNLRYADPFDIEAQKRIAEEIQKANIEQNLEVNIGLVFH